MKRKREEQVRLSAFAARRQAAEEAAQSASINDDDPSEDDTLHSTEEPGAEEDTFSNSFSALDHNTVHDSREQNIAEAERGARFVAKVHKLDDNIVLGLSTGEVWTFTPSLA